MPSFFILLTAVEHTLQSPVLPGSPSCSASAPHHVNHTPLHHQRHIWLLLGNDTQGTAPYPVPSQAAHSRRKQPLKETTGWIYLVHATYFQMDVGTPLEAS